MPLVFVHGVNTRRGATPAEQRVFDDRVELMKHQFSKTAFAGRVSAADGLKVFAPYWGDLGVKFARNLASLPKAGVQSLATVQPDEQIVIAVIIPRFTFEDATGIPVQVTLQASKRKLLESKGSALDAVIKITED